MTDTEVREILQRLQKVDPNIDMDRPIEIDLEWAKEPTVEQAYVSDYDWLSLSVLDAKPLFRFREAGYNGGWMSWRYVYYPTVIALPEEL